MKLSMVGDAVHGVMPKDVSEDVNVDVEVVVDEVVVEDVEDDQVGLCDANVNEDVVVEDDVLQVVEDEDPRCRCRKMTSVRVEDVIYDVHADGKVLLCDAAAEEIVVEPPLGDVVRQCLMLEAKCLTEAKCLMSMNVNADL